jgi:hypothetical protein
MLTRERHVRRPRRQDDAMVRFDTPAGRTSPDLESIMAARDRVTEVYPDRDPGRTDLASLIEDSPDILAAMMKERFERVVDMLIERMVAGDDDPQKQRDALFELYEEELLTKAEVRRRGGIEPEDFYDLLRAYRLRNQTI